MDKWVSKAGPVMSMWNRLNPMQKAALTLILALSVVGMGVAMKMAGAPQYSVLFSNLSPNDANAIVEKLKETKTEYRLSSGGTAVEVASKDVYDLRLQLAGAGLPQGGNVGFELFDKSTFGMTEFTQKLNYQRALQGELQRTIEELSPVAQARVHVVIPEQSLYSDKEKQSSASIVLKLKPGGQLAPDQVTAVTNLVAAAVEGLKPNAVSVVDTAGNLLSDTSAGGAFGSGGLRVSVSQMEMQKNYENDSARDLQMMLDRVLGQGKAVVRVNARMNFDAKQTDSELYEPQQGANGTPGNAGVVTSQEQTEETYAGAPKGMPGSTVLASNLAPVAVATAGKNGDNYKKVQNSTRYEVSKKIEHVTQSPYKIDKLSVAVLLDGKVTSGMSTTIRQTVSAAVGLDPKRGDEVIVDSLPFNRTAEDKEEKDMAQENKRELMMSGIKYGSAVAIAIMFLLVLRSMVGKVKQPMEVSYAQPLSLQEAETMAFQGSDKLELRSDADATPLEGMEIGSPQLVGAGASQLVGAGVGSPQLTGRQASEMAQQRPEDAAKLIRGWLAEG